MVKMSDDIQNRMLSTLEACLLPIARILLRYGISYKQFAEIGKTAFVREAFKDEERHNRRANGSRVSVRTGLSRKEVRRLRERAMEFAESQIAQQAADHSGPPARVLHAWHSDPTFLDSEGQPRVLAIDSPSPSFSDLVRAVAGDVPPGAVRAELIRAAAVAETSSGRLVATKRYYVPGDVDEKAVTMMASLLFPLAAGIDHNSNPSRTEDGFIQRFAYSDRLAQDMVPAFRRWSRKEATAFIEAIDVWLASNENSAQDETGESERSQAGLAGIGVFYYEGPDAGESLR